MQDLIARAVEDVTGSRRTVALTGAGISIESGIPPFRGPGGLWEKIDPMEVAHIDAFRRNPQKVWDLLIRDMHTILAKARPNPAHHGLATLEALGHLQSVVTQNVDGLHQQAGSRDVIEFHGNFAWQRCMDCERRCRTDQLDLKEIPPRCECGGVFRPDCVFFGEMIPPGHLIRSRQLAADCQVMLVVGTSATVHPAAMLPLMAREAGARVIEINPEPTPLTGMVSDYLIPGPAGQVVGALAAAVSESRATS